MLNMELGMYFKRFIFIIGFVFFFFSCKKAEDRSCFKSVGKMSSKEIALPSFELMELYEHLEYELIQDSTDKLVLIGGENLLNSIRWEVNDGKLKIENKNKCNFLRNQNKKVKVEIHFTSLINIYYVGTESMTNKDTLDLPYFTLFLMDGAGSVNLCVKSDILQADIGHGWGDYTLSGKSNYARIAARSNGFCDVYELKVRDSIYVSNASPGKIKLTADQIPLRGKILADGDVYYKGIPTLIEVTESSKGRLIDQN